MIKYILCLLVIYNFNLKKNLQECYTPMKKENIYGLRYTFKHPTNIYQKDGKEIATYTIDTISIFHTSDSIFYRFQNKVQFETGQSIQNTSPFLIHKKGAANGIYLQT